MNRIIIRSVLFTLVSLLLLLVLFRNRLPFGKSNSSFASEPAKEITRIEFSENGEKLTLERKGNNWIVNGNSEARKNGVLFIEKILLGMKIKSPVSTELFEKEIIEKGINPVRVRVFEKRKLLKSFMVYKTQSNPYRNIMKIRDGSKPFIVYVPGYDVDIGSCFTLNELFWQPFKVFNLLPSEIASVHFENLSDTVSSFSIVNNNHKYSFSNNSGNITGFDSTLVSRYLSYFTLIPFETWAFGLAGDENNRIESQQPLYRITVITTGGIITILTLWERMSVDGSNIIKDSDRLYGKTQNSDELFIMRYFDIDPLIKKRSYFFSE